MVEIQFLWYWALLALLLAPTGLLVVVFSEGRSGMRTLVGASMMVSGIVASTLSVTRDLAFAIPFGLGFGGIVAIGQYCGVRAASKYKRGA